MIDKQKGISSRFYQIYYDFVTHYYGVSGFKDERMYLVEIKEDNIKERKVG